MKKKVIEPVTNTIKNTSEDLAKTMILTAYDKNQAILGSNEKICELLNDKGMIAPCLASFLAYLFKHENKSDFKPLKDPNSIRMKDFLIKTSKPVTP